MLTYPPEVDLPHVEGVLDVPRDQLDGQKVVILAPVVEDQPLRLQGLELEVHVDLVVGLKKENKKNC